MNKKFTYLFVALLCLLGGQSAWAQDPVSFIIGDLKYTVTDEANKKVSVNARTYEEDWETRKVQISGELEIPATVVNGGQTYKVTVIENGAFSGMRGINKIILHDNLETIGDLAFFGEYVDYHISSVNIPGTVTNVNSWVFDNCLIDNFTFESSNSELIFNSDLKAENVIINRDVVCQTWEGYDRCFFADNYLQTVTIGGNATRIANVFATGNANLRTVVIGGNVTEIGNDAFNSCSSLSSVTINSNLTSIGNDAFRACYALQSLELPATLQSIGYQTFMYAGLKSLSIPGSLTSIGGNVFEACIFDSFTFEESETLLNFSGTTINTKHATVNRQLTNDGYESNVPLFASSFGSDENVGSLESVSFGGKLTNIPAYYLRNNLDELATITIGESVTSIEAGAFRQPAIKDVYVYATTPITITEDVFPETLVSGNKLWVPAGSKAAYQAATGWSLFDNIQPTHYIVNLNTVGTGTVTLDGKTEGDVLVAYDATDILFTLAAGEDYDFTKLNNGTNDVYTNASQGASLQGGTYTLPSISDDMTFTATFTEKPKFAITATATGGTATASAVQVYRDRDAYVTFAAYEGHELTSVKLNDVEVISQVADNKLTMANIQDAKNVVATFTLIHYTVSTAATENGTITLAATDVQWGNGTTATITPSAGYMIDHVFLNGVNADTQLSGNILNINNVSANTEVSATFRILSYRVTITGEGVSASNEYPQHGDNVTITVAEDSDRELTSLLVNDVEQKNNMVGNTYTINNVTGDVTVAATFRSTVESITVSSHGVGTYACSQDLNFTGSDLKAYIAVGFNKSTGDVLLSRVYDVPAGTGIYLVAEEGTYKIRYSTSSSCYVNMLVGNTGDAINLPGTTGDKTNYYLTSEGFIKSAGSATIRTNRAYLQIPTNFVADPAHAKVGIVFEDDLMTGIEEFTMVNKPINGRIYNINGQQVNKLGKGIFIINGKKFKK